MNMPLYPLKGESLIQQASIDFAISMNRIGGQEPKSTQSVLYDDSDEALAIYVDQGTRILSSSKDAVATSIWTGVLVNALTVSKTVGNLRIQKKTGKSWASGGVKTLRKRQSSSPGPDPNP